MSHFSVLVVGENPEKQLAPFQENNCGDCPKEYLKFNETETEYKTQYETESIECVIMPDGRQLSRFDDEFRVPGTIGVSFGSGWSASHVVPDEFPIKDIPFKELYSTFENFVFDHHGVDERDSETGKYGYWENPNKKWDWYELGGRWAGFFTLKEVGEGVQGVHYGKSVASVKSNQADQAYKFNIDFNAMRDDKGGLAAEEYEMVKSLFGGIIPKLEKTWDEIREDKSLKDVNINDKRDLYWGQSPLKHLKKLAETESWKNEKEQKFLLYGLSEFEEFQCTKSQYVLNARNKAITTFAIIKDGTWYERGSMGWWGCVSDEKSQSVWNVEFNALIDALPEDVLLSVYDCHI